MMERVHRRSSEHHSEEEGKTPARKRQQGMRSEAEANAEDAQGTQQQEGPERTRLQPP